MSLPTQSLETTDETCHISSFHQQRNMSTKSPAAKALAELPTYELTHFSQTVEQVLTFTDTSCNFYVLPIRLGSV